MIINNLPEHFVYLREIDSSIIQDVRYATSNNFLGRRVNGYENAVVIITRQAAEALASAQQELRVKGLSLKVFDAYRPQRACDDFWNWANDLSDFKMQSLYYPDFNCKADLFNGFIARYSNHSRGSAVDLTIVDTHTMEELDMGAMFDFFGDISYTQSDKISNKAHQNRMMLLELMLKHGFKNYSKEWWHYELIDEPYKRKPEDHFDFLVA